MLYIEDDVIKLTRGDTAFIGITLTDQSGAPYTPSVEDHIYFRLKTSILAKELSLEKECQIIPSDEDPEEVQILLELEEADTEYLKFGAYKYEIELVTSENYHFTVIDNADFELGAELENHNE